MVRSKAYTLNRLIAEVSSLNTRKVTDLTTLADNLSPVAGVNSAKFQVLNTFLNGELDTFVSRPSYGKTVKQRVLKALRARKRYGSDFNV
jgi:hypothetical protein